MANVRGAVSVKTGGKTYKLFVGMSVLADLQAEFGQDVLGKLDAPDGAGDDWMPDLKIVMGLFAGALERYHPDDVDRWLVDDIIAASPTGFAELMAASFPDAPKGEAKSKPSGNAKGPKSPA